MRSIDAFVSETIKSKIDRRSVVNEVNESWMSERVERKSETLSEKVKLLNEEVELLSERNEREVKNFE